MLSSAASIRLNSSFMPTVASESAALIISGEFVPPDADSLSFLHEEKYTIRKKTPTEIIVKIVFDVFIL